MNELDISDIRDRANKKRAEDYTQLQGEGYSDYDITTIIQSFLGWYITKITKEEHKKMEGR